jgi:hypothetical protein
MHPEVVGRFLVPQTSKSAVSRVSKPAGRPPSWRARPSQNRWRRLAVRCIAGGPPARQPNPRPSAYLGRPPSSHRVPAASAPGTPPVHRTMHPEVVGRSVVPQTSKSAVSRVSKPAGRPPSWRARPSQNRWRELAVRCIAGGPPARQPNPRPSAYLGRPPSAHHVPAASAPGTPPVHRTMHPEVVGRFLVPQTSKSAVSRVSKPAGRPPSWRARPSQNRWRRLAVRCIAD